jgi:CBS domain-containing protein
MNVGTICQRLVFTVRRSEEVISAAQIMREKHVGYLVVVEPDSSGKLLCPVGVLSDRDIVITVVARDVSPKALQVGDIMSVNPVTVGESSSIEEALQAMRQFGIRRLPVVGQRGELVGILAADDVLRVLAGDTQDVVAAIANERQVEAVRRR